MTGNTAASTVWNCSQCRNSLTTLRPARYTMLPLLVHLRVPIYQWGECCICHFTHSFTISPFFLSLMSSIAGCDGHVPIRSDLRNKHSHIEEALLLLTSPNIHAGTGCNSGSVRTSIQTSQGRPAAKPRLSLCLITQFFFRLLGSELVKRYGSTVKFNSDPR